MINDDILRNALTSTTNVEDAFKSLKGKVADDILRNALTSTTNVEDAFKSLKPKPQNFMDKGFMSDIEDSGFKPRDFDEAMHEPEANPDGSISATGGKKTQPVLSTNNDMQETGEYLSLTGENIASNFKSLDTAVKSTIGRPAGFMADKLSEAIGIKETDGKSTIDLLVEQRVAENIALDAKTNQYNKENPDVLMNPENTAKVVSDSILFAASGLKYMLNIGTGVVVGASEAYQRGGDMEDMAIGSAKEASYALIGTAGARGVLHGVNKIFGTKILLDDLGHSTLNKLVDDLKIDDAAKRIEDYEILTGRTITSNDEKAFALMASHEDGKGLLSVAAEKNKKVRQSLTTMAADIESQLKLAVQGGDAHTSAFLKYSKKVNGTYNKMEAIGKQVEIKEPIAKEIIKDIVQENVDALDLPTKRLIKELNDGLESGLTLSNLVNAKKHANAKIGKGLKGANYNLKSAKGVLEEIINREFTKVSPNLRGKFKEIDAHYTLKNELGLGKNKTSQEEFKNKLSELLDYDGRTSGLSDTDFTTRLVSILSSGKVTKGNMDRISKVLGKDMHKLETGIIKELELNSESYHLIAPIVRKLNMATYGGKFLKDRIIKIDDAFKSIVDIKSMNQLISQIRNPNEQIGGMTDNLVAKLRYTLAGGTFKYLTQIVRRTAGNENALFQAHMGQLTKALNRLDKIRVNTDFNLHKNPLSALTGKDAKMNQSVEMLRNIFREAGILQNKNNLIAKTPQLEHKPSNFSRADNGPSEFTGTNRPTRPDGFDQQINPKAKTQTEALPFNTEYSKPINFLQEELKIPLENAKVLDERILASFSNSKLYLEEALGKAKHPTQVLNIVESKVTNQIDRLVENIGVKPGSKELQKIKDIYSLDILKQLMKDCK